MPRGWYLAVLALCVWTSATPAQAPQFRWRAGQVMTFKVSQATSATEVMKDQTLVTTSQLDLVKRWQVTDVDAAGVATLQMTLQSLRMETKPPAGEALVFDSANPAKSHAQLRDEMQKYIGPPLTVVRIDPRGQLVEVKESKFGPGSRLQCDLPFKLVLPTAALAVGQNWERTYQIKLDPPQGAGETFEAVQTYTCKALNQGLGTIRITTKVKNLPEAAADQLPLLPLMPEGDIYFDVNNGTLRAVRYQFGHELNEHRGEGSKYQFKSVYNEDLVETK